MRNECKCGAQWQRIANIEGDLTLDLCNGPNELYSHGYDPCPPQTCKSVVDGISCAAYIRPPKTGCRCKEGFYRNEENSCVTEDACKKRNTDCLKPNEYRDCGTACDNECSTLATQNRTSCPVASFVCNDRCYCRDGFARDSEHNCVPVEQCGKVEKK